MERTRSRKSYDYLHKTVITQKNKILADNLVFNCKVQSDLVLVNFAHFTVVIGHYHDMMMSTVYQSLMHMCWHGVIINAYVLARCAHARGRWIGLQHRADFLHQSTSLCTEFHLLVAAILFY